MRWAAAFGRFALAVGSACGGDPFMAADPGAADGAGIDGALTLGDGGPSGTAVGEATTPSADSATTPSPCGPLRTGDARESCFDSLTFSMGSNDPNLGGQFADHTPAHSVTLRAFAIDAYEVSVARYRACVSAGSCTAPATGAQCTYTASPGAGESMPVVCVTWAQAGAFCQFEGHRLPTEAEWELAARGATARSYPWGEIFDCSKAVVGAYPGGACSSYTGPSAVDAMGAGATPEQVFNLAGNAAEWVADWMGSYRAGAQTDPTGPATGSMKIVRGGSFSNTPTAALGYARIPMSPTAVGSWGFRCARDPN